MTWRVAESLKTLRGQINAAYPNRDKTSDGSIGDTAHSARKSDHNPNAAGVVCAIDIDEDLTPSNTVAGIVAQIQMSRDPRVKYIIYEGQITVKGDITQWKPYHGVNPHRHHAHISVVGDARLYDDPSPWHIAGPLVDDVVTMEPETVRDVKLGDKGTDVKAIQEKLGVSADGIFGKNTERAVIKFQLAHDLNTDGIVGSKTRQAMGL